MAKTSHKRYEFKQKMAKCTENRLAARLILPDPLRSLQRSPKPLYLDLGKGFGLQGLRGQQKEEKEEGAEKRSEGEALSSRFRTSTESGHSRRFVAVQTT